MDRNLEGWQGDGWYVFSTRKVPGMLHDGEAVRCGRGRFWQTRADAAAGGADDLTVEFAGTGPVPDGCLTGDADDWVAVAQIDQTWLYWRLGHVVGAGLPQSVARPLCERALADWDEEQAALSEASARARFHAAVMRRSVIRDIRDEDDA